MCTTPDFTALSIAEAYSAAPLLTPPGRRRFWLFAVLTPFCGCRVTAFRLGLVWPVERLNPRPPPPIPGGVPPGMPENPLTHPPNHNSPPSHPPTPPAASAVGRPLAPLRAPLFSHPRPPAARPPPPILALGPVSRILFRALRRFGRHFSHVRLAAASPSEARLRERSRVRHTRGYWTGRPATYFALHRTGFFVPPTSPLARWALTPPFHPYPHGCPRGGMFSVTLSVTAP